MCSKKEHLIFPLQKCNICQEKSRRQTFVVDCKHLLSFAVVFIVDLQCNKKITSGTIAKGDYFENQEKSVFLRLIVGALEYALEVVVLHQLLQSDFVVRHVGMHDVQTKKLTQSCWSFVAVFLREGSVG